MASEEKDYFIHPKKMIVWLFIVSMVMLFAGLTSAYIVRKSEGDWMFFQLPELFKISTWTIVLSSLSLQLAFIAAKKDQITMLRAMLGVSVVLGFVFLVLQWNSWAEIYTYDNPVVFGGKYSNPSGSFLYILSGLHGVHLIGGLIFLLIVLISAFYNKINSKNLVRMEMCTTFWHFLGILWIYLYIFLIYNH